MTSPVSPVKSNTSAAATPGSCTPYCPPGRGCIEVVCGGGYCPLPDCANCPACQTAVSKRSADAELVDRQSPPFRFPPFACLGPFCSLPGCVDAPACQNTTTSKRSPEVAVAARQFLCDPPSNCIRPACLGPFCSLPGCVDAPACQNTTTSKRSPEVGLADRQFECPPGIECGPGPVCTEATCDLPGCADAEVCQDQDKKRDLAERQFGCPPGVPCGHGPECTAEICDLPGCADADVCQDPQVSKRKAETGIIRPVCDVCTVLKNGRVDCCGTILPKGGLEPRESERICPLFCIATPEGELCGCAAQDYLNSLEGY